MFLDPLPQSEIKHMTMQSVFTKFCERMNHSNKLRKFKCGTAREGILVQVFPPRYDQLWGYYRGCYCKVEAFRNRSNSASKWQTVQSYTVIAKC